MFQTELLLQKELLKHEERQAHQSQELWSLGLVDVKQQIEVKSQKEDAGCSDGG